ncbi:TATA box-binding protein-associated factor RNA polymerase I subunit B [Xyrichtys novacula]|uniref:TATA box-binding protein-associated factor RNA polymerase I subunit B n=1 Tax=Xyrichtys novacula TaxID=13765 RepID=A0AAV1GXG2_XYRNO|nr:TATA box-binding protein-associated factor RNA polymerase I subunit B [Xyrichtys novacula]
MDEEHTADYREPCAQCSAVDWGISDEGHFYCKSCHNVIERTKEVDPTFIAGANKINSMRARSRNKGSGHSRWQWMVCEGFQFILMKQADALLRLGVQQQFKDKVLCELWRLYLQKSNLAYTHTPMEGFKPRHPASDSDSAPESSQTSAFETEEEEANLPGSAGSNNGSRSSWSVCSGSEDAGFYLSARHRRGYSPMTMERTLALIHIALTWSREPLTLSDLLRLVNEGHVPFVNAYKEFPEEMKFHSKDSLIFRVEGIPSYQHAHKEAQIVTLFLKLPAFPPISRQNLLHPSLLSLRYLTDINLPDDLHPLLCKLMEIAGMADEKPYTYNPQTCPFLPKHDMQTAAFIIVTMKFVFGLDDRTEWDLSSKAGNRDKSGDGFSPRRWYKLLQAALIRAQNKRDYDMARKQWRAMVPLYTYKYDRCKVMKRRRAAEQLQLCFERLSSRPAAAEPVSPSSFTFCWGDEDGADGPSMHHMKLVGISPQSSSDPTNWHSAFRPSVWKCGCRYADAEAMLPRTFLWLLQLFSFLLDVKPKHLYREVLRVERSVFAMTTWRKRRKMTSTTRRTRTRSMTRAHAKMLQTERSGR